MKARETRKRVSPMRVARWLALAVGGLLLTSLAACGSALKAPPQSGVRFADATAQASMVYMQVNWRGWVVLSRNVDISSTEFIEKGVYGPFTAVTSCSGFVASGSGDIVTAGHCVDATSVYGGKGVILEAMAAKFTHANGQPLTPAEQASQVEILSANASVEGYESGSPVERTVHATIPAVSTTSRIADVVDVKPFKEGDVALLRVTGLQAPMLPVASSAPVNGDSIVAAGYPGEVAAAVDPSTSASFKEGTVSGTQTVNGVPFTEISAEVSAGMSGGPVVNMSGQVVGTVSWSPQGSTSAANFMTDAGSIRSVLAGNGVNTKLTPADQAFRQGLAYYFARRYHEAVMQFDRGLALQPGQTTAQQYRQLAVARYPQDVNPPSSGLPLWAYLAIGGGVLVLAVGAGVILIRRRRARPSGERAARPAPEPVPPEPAQQAGPAPEPVPPGPAQEARPAPEPVPPEPVQQTEPIPETAAPAGTTGQERYFFCPNCGAPHPRDAHYCEQCGQPFPAGLPAEQGGDDGIRK